MPTLAIYSRQESTVPTTRTPYLEGIKPPLTSFLPTTIFQHSFLTHDPKLLQIYPKLHNSSKSNSSNLARQILNIRCYVHFLQNSSGNLRYLSLSCRQGSQPAFFYPISNSRAKTFYIFYNPSILTTQESYILTIFQLLIQTLRRLILVSMVCLAIPQLLKFERRNRFYLIPQKAPRIRVFSILVMVVRTSIIRRSFLL